MAAASLVDQLLTTPPPWPAVGTSPTPQLADLPPQFDPHYTPGFARQFLVAFLDLTARLTADQWTPPSCVAQDLGVRLLLDQADLIADLAGLPLPPDWQDTLAELLLEDIDHEYLYDPALDGFEDDPDFGPPGMASMRVQDWFHPSPAAPLPPYLNLTAEPPNRAQGESNRRERTPAKRSPARHARASRNDAGRHSAAATSGAPRRTECTFSRFGRRPAVPTGNASLIRPLASCVTELRLPETRSGCGSRVSGVGPRRSWSATSDQSSTASRLVGHDPDSAGSRLGGARELRAGGLRCDPLAVGPGHGGCGHPMSDHAEDHREGDRGQDHAELLLWSQGLQR